MDAILDSGNFDALIEAGGLLAGSSNAVVADHVLERIVKHKGVVYFEPSMGTGMWMVVDVEGVHEPLAKSALHEADCFVVYDQSRTRGADMKLKHNAKALVTLGPKMTKDSTMQAVGRMRKINVSFSFIQFNSISCSRIQFLNCIQFLNFIIFSVRTNCRVLRSTRSNCVNLRAMQCLSKS